MSYLTKFFKNVPTLCLFYIVIFILVYDMQLHNDISVLAAIWVWIFLIALHCGVQVKHLISLNVSFLVYKIWIILLLLK